MRFTPTPLAGAYIIDPNLNVDGRGFFARTLCVSQFRDAGLDGQMVQQSVSWNPRRGTLRGLHYQASPNAENKLVRVTRGAIFDVIVDIRTDSTTFGAWFGLELSAENRRQIYIPKGFAHGFQTQTDDSEVFYQMTVQFHEEASKGILWSDPDLAISWPLPDLALTDGFMSAKDRDWPELSKARLNL